MPLFLRACGRLYGRLILRHKINRVVTQDPLSGQESTSRLQIAILFAEISTQLLGQGLNYAGMNLIPSRHPAKPPVRELLHRHRLGQIPWLVHVRAACNRGVIRQQLQRHHVEDG